MSILYHRCKAHLSDPKTYDAPDARDMAKASVAMADRLVALEKWFDTDQDVLDRLRPDELADHARQHGAIIECLKNAVGKLK